MARRSRAVKFRRGKRNLTWVTSAINSSIVDNSVADIGELVLPLDWSSSAGYDHCTLLSIRGWYCLSQHGASTTLDVVGAFMAIYKTAIQAPPNAMLTPTAQAYADYDVLYTDGMAFGSSSTWVQPSVQIDVKTKRKLGVDEELRLALGTDADSALNPRCNLVGVFRMLLDLD